MNILRTLYDTVIEALFPISKAEKELFAMSPAEALEKLPPSPEPPIPNAHSIFAYKDERVSKLVWNIKYKRSVLGTAIAGHALYEYLKAHPHQTVIIPMPITPRRRRERGYNQCELLVEELERLDSDKDSGKKILIIKKDVLIRTHHASRQTLKNRSDRLQSAKGIFSVNNTNTINKEPINLPIIIIDDVITTGSTLKEAMETMHNAGFQNVSGLSIAH